MTIIRIHPLPEAWEELLTMPEAKPKRSRRTKPATGPGPKPETQVRTETELGRVHDVWTAKIGELPIGRLGKAVYPAIHRYGVEAVLVAVARYAAANEGKTMKAEWFAQSIVTWLPKDEPLVDQWGALTPAGIRIYRGGGDR